ncbi:hypothetical protein GWI33_011557 [Rhynchophorus ferrugineus]|uniref:Cytochrome P450 n=1 Tax=Rhynchophorus ferrugineus TaxID=354439 RepID=A0A834MJ76_RHYFE|nr:hypothetical protein GWI33_011557 [Rhynchophorus ferrugineus]
MCSKLKIADGDLFIIGHLLEVTCSLEQMFLLLRRWSRTEHMKPMFIGRIGPYLFLNTADPDIIEDIISASKHLEKSTLYRFLDLWLGKGLLTSTGTLWHTRRKILTSAFHFSILQNFISIFNEGGDKLVETIKQDSKDSVDVVPLVSDATLHGINSTSMGAKMESIEGGIKYKNNVGKITYYSAWRCVRPWLFNDIFYYYFTSNGRKERQLLRSSHAFIDDLIKRRAAGFQVFDVDNEISFGQGRKKLAMLDLLLNEKIKNNAIDNQGIRDEVNTFVFEGHDTTASNLSFMLMLLACHRDIQDQVYEELQHILGPELSREPTYADLQEMNLMERCIKESLRLYPSVPFIGRIASEDIVTKAGIIPKGLSINIHIYDVHRDPQYWPDPETFDPSRFLPENCRNRHPYSYIPFSAGPRNCIGQRFAILEIKSILCKIFKNFILEPIDTPESLVLVQELTLRSVNGIKVKFVPRINKNK